MTIYERALEFVRDGDCVGLGSGRAASEFIRLLGQRCREGLHISGVPTSAASERLAREVGVPLVDLSAAIPLALTVDGADEVDPELQLIKGYGRALVRERIVAAASQQLVILVGKEKCVERLGSHGKLPLEVVPFAVPLVLYRLEKLGMPGRLYEEAGRVFVSDNGNAIIDCHISALNDPVAVQHTLQDIPGVVGTGLFLGMADIVLIGDEHQGFVPLEERRRGR